MPDHVQRLLQGDQPSNDRIARYSLHGPKTEGSPLGIKEVTIIRQSEYPTASGFLGNVYKCKRKSDSFDEVAVKSFRFGRLNEAEGVRISKIIDHEICIRAGLEHQYVLPFYGTVEGFGPFRASVSPWMPNGNLNSYLNSSDVSLTEMDRLILLIQITEGLKYLHDNDVVHHNLTSNNILIAADGSPRLADFGISNNFRDSHETYSLCPSLFRWIAPEFLAGTINMTLLEEILLLEKEILLQERETLLRDIKSGDIYSLGCIILEVLYGKVPYWWIKNSVHVLPAKCNKVEPIRVDSSFQIQHNHLGVMRQCWSDEREARPSVDEVLNFLLTLYEELELASPLRTKLDVTNVESTLDSDATRRRTKLNVGRGILQGIYDKAGLRELRDSNSKVDSITAAVRNNALAYKSCICSQECDWDNALYNARMSINIKPSWPGYISKGIALCGKMQLNEAMKAFDLAFMFTDQDLNITQLLLLVKAVALFNANQREEALLRIHELATVYTSTDTFACYVVKAYLYIQWGINALNGARYNEAADHFTTAINTGVLSPELTIHTRYEIFGILFGWDLATSWQIAHQKRCHAFLQAGMLVEAHEAYKNMMDMCDEVTKASYLDWSTAFEQQYVALCVAGGNDASVARAYDKAIELYTAAIDLDPTTATTFANRCEVKMEKMLWEQALDDAQKVTELDPSSYLGYRLKHAALHGAQRYDEAIKVAEIMFKLDNDPSPETQAVRRQYISPTEAQGVIRQIVDAIIKDIPPRLVDTSTGRLCDREAQVNAFKTTLEYEELLSLTIKDANLQSERTRSVASTFFQYAMLSHRWEGKEPLLNDIRGLNVYESSQFDGIGKLQSFCKTVRDSGLRWAWVDTCCIDQNSNVEVQRSVNSMFAWYRHSALTIVYLSDAPPSSNPGAIARSTWVTRGWTLQEFLAPKVVLFYQNDWTLYLDARSLNHKESAGIMRELEDATRINARALTAFCPGMRGAREKLQWASMRVTTLPEDTAYSLFGIFGIELPLIHGEKEQNALGRLLQEIIALSGDISCLDWAGKSSEFNSCLPANITSYAAPPFVVPSLSEDEMQTAVSSLRGAGVVELASQLYTKPDLLATPRFAQRRLLLPCVVFTVTQVALRPSQEQETCFTYTVKANGLHDLLIKTEDKLVPFSCQILDRQKLLLVRPWDRNVMKSLYDFGEPSSLADDAQSTITEYSTAKTVPSSSLGGADNVLINSEFGSRALRLIVGLGQPFRALLLAATQQWGREYSRIAADDNIIAQVKNMASVRDMMDVRTLEIL